MDRRRLLADGSHPVTYCTNVHPARTLDEAERICRETAAPILRAALGDGTLLLGAWWPQDVAFELASNARRLDAHAALCRELGVVPASLNIFPMGRFHGEAVKAAVYAPDWSSDARLAYSLAAARAVTVLCAPFGLTYAVMSTVPLGFRGERRDARPHEAHARQVFRAAVALEELAARSGVTVVLALEPEPWCLLESIGEAVAWCTDSLFPYAARAGNEAAARRHVGLCIDLCHAAVVGESVHDGLELCSRSGIRIGKVQLSSAIVARGAAGRDALLGYDEPVYLHQTWDRRGRGPFLDLSEPALAAVEMRDDDVLTSHFHVPLHWAGEGALESTRNEVEACLDRVVEAGLVPEGVPLEVETYTNPAIADELVWAVTRLTRPTSDSASTPCH